MTAATPKVLNLDSTDLKWLGEKLDHLEGGSFKTQSATFRSDYLNQTFKARRIGQTSEDDGTLVLSIRVLG